MDRLKQITGKDKIIIKKAACNIRGSAVKKCALENDNSVLLCMLLFYILTIIRNRTILTNVRFRIILSTKEKLLRNQKGEKEGK